MTERITINNLAEINAWCALRGLPAMTIEAMPSIGFWVPGVMAGFLLTPSGQRAIVDYFISNPATTASQRKEAIASVLASIKTQASLMGYTELMSTTNNSTLINTFKDNGYDVGLNYACVTMTLTGGV